MFVLLKGTECVVRVRGLRLNITVTAQVSHGVWVPQHCSQSYGGDRMSLVETNREPTDALLLVVCWR